MGGGGRAELGAWALGEGVGLSVSDDSSVGDDEDFDSMLPALLVLR